MYDARNANMAPKTKEAAMRIPKRYLDNEIVVPFSVISCFTGVDWACACGLAVWVTLFDVVVFLGGVSSARRVSSLAVSSLSSWSSSADSDASACSLCLVWWWWCLCLCLVLDSSNRAADDVSVCMGFNAVMRNTACTYTHTHIYIHHTSHITHHTSHITHHKQTHTHTSHTHTHTSHTSQKHSVSNSSYACSQITWLSVNKWVNTHNTHIITQTSANLHT